jgi:lysozyme
MDEREMLRTLLGRHEGRRSRPYDDATGKTIMKGSTVRGYPTIGIGHNLEARPLPDWIIDEILYHDIDDMQAELRQRLPWVMTLDEIRYVVLCDMAFNMGVSKLLQFKRTLGHIEHGEYPEAAAAMLDSLWARQVGQRAHRLARMMRTGQWPADMRAKHVG